MPPQSKRQKRGEKRTTSGTRKSQRASVKRAISTVNDKDWREGKTLSESMLTMFTDEISCDVHFLCGEDEVKVGAHKFILLCRSSVFYAMFEGPAGNQDSEVKIPDITADIFRSFLRYMYSDKADITEENLMQIIYVGKKYQVNSLINECSVYIKKILTVDNACTLFEASHTFSESALHHTVLEFIQDNVSAIYLSHTYKTLCRQCFGEILDSDVIRCGDYSDEEEDWDNDSSPSGNNRNRSRDVGGSHGRRPDGDRGAGGDGDPDGGEANQPDTVSTEEPYDAQYTQNVEGQLFRILLSWTDNECEKQNLELTGENRRLVAGDLLYKIRYGFLESQFLVGFVTKSGLLTMEEKCLVMEYLLCPEITTNIFWKNEDRTLHSSAMWFTRFGSKSHDRYVNCKGIEAISLICFEDLYIHGFAVYRSAYEKRNSEKYTILAKVVDESKEVLSETRVEYEDEWRTADEVHRDVDRLVERLMDPKTINFRHKDRKSVMLNRKLLLKKGCRYSIVMDIHGPDSYSGDDFGDNLMNGNSYILHYPEDNAAAGARRIVEIVNYDGEGYAGFTDLHFGQISDLAFSFCNEEGNSDVQ